MAKATQSTDDILRDMAQGIRNSTLDAAAKVAAMYGAPQEAIEKMLQLKAKREDAR
jgi:hypothetical protein